MVAEICTATMFPTKDDMITMFKPLSSDLPSLPTLSMPMFGGLHSPELEFDVWVQGAMHTLQANIAISIPAALKGIQDFTTALSYVSVPGVPTITFKDFLDSNVDKIKVALKDFPNPFSDISVPTIEPIQKQQRFFLDMLKTVIDKLTELMQPILSIINGLPYNAGFSIPSMPSLPTWEELKSSVHEVEIKSPENPILSFNGFPPITLPKAHKASITSVDSEVKITGVMTEMMNTLLKLWTDFVQRIVDTFGSIFGLSFPKPSFCASSVSCIVKIS